MAMLRAWHWLLVSATLAVLVGRGQSSWDCSFPSPMPGPPTARVPVVALGETGTMAFNDAACSFTFQQYRGGHSDYMACEHNPPISIHTCPRDCLRSLLGRTQPAVYGSFPYSANSSICLAAIHTGLINATTGGGVWWSPTFPFDWSGTETQTLWPNESWRGSLSFGVQSLDVPEETRRTPAPVNSFAYSLRTAGLAGSQRQTAPFSPRTGHLHVELEPTLLRRVGWYQGNYWQLIIGGRTSTGYSNEMHLYNGTGYYDGDNVEPEGWGTWHQLPLAPFTPRAFMQYHLIVDPPLPSLQTGSGVQSLFVLIIGGQTDHICGEPRLGICSQEVWALRIRLVAAGQLTFEWQPWSFLMPSPARCDAAVIVDRRMLTPRQSRIVGVVGGQLSLTNDSACTNSLQTLNSSYYAEWPELNRWTEGREAPFSPRRGMHVDDALINSDVLSNGSVPSGMDKTVSLVGGVQYHSYRWEAQLQRSVLVNATIHASVWSCALIAPEWDSNLTAALDCDYHLTWPLPSWHHAEPPAPTGSYPIPVAHSASLHYPAGRFFLNLRVGGVTSASAVRQWKDVRPRNEWPMDVGIEWDEVVNVSVIAQPLLTGGRGSAAPTLDEVLHSRYDLPLAFDVDEEELNDPLGPFQLGSDVAVSHNLPRQTSTIQAVLTTAQRQPNQRQPGDDPGNSSRALLDWSNRRHGHAMGSAWNVLFISGGESGGQLSNDWITWRHPFCFLPQDPHYLHSLGPVKSLSVLTNDGTGYAHYWANPWDRFQYGTGLNSRDVGVATLGVINEVRCAVGYHWSPPSRDEVVQLTCAANALWVDAQIGSVRRCVADLVSRPACPPPLVWAGFQQCSDPAPRVDRVRVLDGRWKQNPGVLPHEGGLPVQVEGLSMYRNEWQFDFAVIIEGAFFTDPLEVWALRLSASSVQIPHFAYPCYSPHLLNLTRTCFDVNRGDHVEKDCRTFGSQVLCLMPRVGDTRLTLTTGRGFRRRTFQMWTASGITRDSTPLSVTFAKPVIVSMSADGDCSTLPGAPHQLVGCPNDRQFVVDICAAQVTQLDDSDWDPAFSINGQPLECNTVRRRGYSGNQTQCWGNAQMLCDTWVVCTSCKIQPPPSLRVNVLLTQFHGIPSSNNADQNAELGTAASLSFQPCAAGTFTNYTATYQQRCQLCPPGTSTEHAPGGQSCTPCPPGKYSATNGSEDCVDCPEGTYADLLGSLACKVCQGNFWSTTPQAAISCNECPANTYKVVNHTAPSNQGSTTLISTVPKCFECPPGAACGVGQNRELVRAERSGVWLLVDPVTGEVSSMECAPTACVVPLVNDSVLTDGEYLNRSEVIPSSGIHVFNFCGSRRRSAVAEDGSANPLCAECVPGYSLVAGECVPCEGAQWSAVALLTISALTVVYALHRWFDDSQGRATLSIALYFVQMSALFLPSDVLPWVFTLLSFDWFVSEAHWLDRCVLPMNDADIIVMRLITPALCVLLLAALLDIQLTASAIGRFWRSCESFNQPHHPILQEDGEHSVRPHRRLFRLYQQVFQLLFTVRLSAASLRTEEVSEPLLGDRLSPSVGSRGRRSGGAAGGSAECFTTQWLVYRRTLLRLGLFSYNSVGSVCFTFFHTHSVGRFGERLIDYPQLRTDDLVYIRMRPVIVVVLTLFVVGGPLGLLSQLLWLRWRRLIGPDTDTQVSKGSVIAMTVLTYQPRYFLFPVLVLVRRLVLISIAVFSRTNGYTWLTMANYAILTLHLVTWPYKHGIDSALETMTLGALALQTNILSAYPTTALMPGSAQTLLSMLLLVPMAVILLLAIAHAVSRRWLKLVLPHWVPLEWLQRVTSTEDRELNTATEPPAQGRSDVAGVNVLELSRPQPLK